MKEQQVDQHYGRPDLLDGIVRALRQAGKDVGQLRPADLAPVDEFHIRGREATIELANSASLKPGLRVLDVGCGIGGSARFLASEHHCRVTGIDLTKQYVDAANGLAGLVGMSDVVEFQQGSALNLPFADESFDVVWTEHAQMNIPDKRTFYAEIARVLVPGGQLLFHDIFQGPGGVLHYPVPWAHDESISFLATPESVRRLLQDLSFSIIRWDDTSQASLDWFVAAVARLRGSAPSPLGLHLLMGETSQAKFANNIKNLQERRFVVLQAVAEKRMTTSLAA